MKIAILTLRLRNNYGGLLQNYALQTILIRSGHDPITIYIADNKIRNNINLIGSIIKRSFLRLLGSKNRIRVLPTVKESQLISKYTSKFVKERIKTTEPILRISDDKFTRKYDFDAYIVGSDQVWRPRKSSWLSTYFLDFLEENKNIKRIAFSASFGINEWNFDQTQIKSFGYLLKLFDAISVRETNAVSMCKEYFDIDVMNLIDPTMLLTKEEYISLTIKDYLKINQSDFLIYILDKDGEKDKLVKYISERFSWKPFSVMPKKHFTETGRANLNDCVFPPVEEWLRGFMDAKFVVTDSFHGTVFSILFNVPFIAIGNEKRGMARFESLLNIFKLGDRLVTDLNLSNVGNIISKKIDWNKVNTILVEERRKAADFLRVNLDN